MKDLCSKYSELALIRDDYSLKLGFAFRPKLFLNRNKDKISGIAYAKNVSLNARLIVELDRNPNVVKAMIAHEFIHIKYRDFYNNLSRIFSMFSKEFTAISILHEIRANIEGYALTGFNHNEIYGNEMYLKRINQNGDKASMYSAGYPSREQSASYAQNHNVMNVEVAKEILTDFCEVMKISDPKLFIERCLRKAKMS